LLSAAKKAILDSKSDAQRAGYKLLTTTETEGIKEFKFDLQMFEQN